MTERFGHDHVMPVEVLQYLNRTNNLGKPRCGGRERRPARAVMTGRFELSSPSSWDAFVVTAQPRRCNARAFTCPVIDEACCASPQLAKVPLTPPELPACGCAFARFGPACYEMAGKAKERGTA
jgi:hypothetical protein